MVLWLLYVTPAVCSYALAVFHKIIASWALMGMVSRTSAQTS